MIAKNYLSTRAQEKYSAMRQLYNNSGVMALVGSLRKYVYSFDQAACCLSVFNDWIFVSFFHALPSPPLSPSSPYRKD